MECETNATWIESLFHLIREGSSTLIRNDAAKKLGQLATQSPHTCQKVLYNLFPLIKHSNWDIRVAAALCLGVIARSLQSIHSILLRKFAEVSFGTEEQSNDLILNFENVDLQQLVDEGSPLLKSGGKEYTYYTNLSAEERRIAIYKQRKALLHRLCGEFPKVWNTVEDSLTQTILPNISKDHVIEISEAIDESDLDFDQSTVIEKTTKRKTPAEATIMLTKRLKRMDQNILKMEESQANDISHIIAETVCDLFECVFDACWEVRHGAFLSLREIFVSSSIGKIKPRNKLTSQECQWLSESIFRCVCVLALDQFVDYSADESMAPVRDLAAQVFGILFNVNLKYNINDEKVLSVYVQLLRKLLGVKSTTVSSNWHARHGGLLGLKYILKASFSSQCVDSDFKSSSLLSYLLEDVISVLESDNPIYGEDLHVIAIQILDQTLLYIPILGNFQQNRICKVLLMRLEFNLSGQPANSNPRTLGFITAATLQLFSSSRSVEKLCNAFGQQNFEPFSRLIVDKVINYPDVTALFHYPSLSATRIAISDFFTLILVNQEMYRACEDLNRLTPVIRVLPHILYELCIEGETIIRKKFSNTWKACIRFIIKQSCTNSQGLSRIIENNVCHWLRILCGEVPHSLETFLQHPEVTDEINQRCTSKSIELCSSEAIGTFEIRLAENLGIFAAQIPIKHHERLRLELITKVQSASSSIVCGALLCINNWVSQERNATEEESSGAAERLSKICSYFDDVLTKLSRDEYEKKSHYYLELQGKLTRLRRMESRLIEIFSNAGISTTSYIIKTEESLIINARRIAENVMTFPYERLKQLPHDSSDSLSVFDAAHFKRQDMFVLEDEIQRDWLRHYNRILGLAAVVYCNLLPIPQKSGFLVKSLMESTRTEVQEALMPIFTESLAIFAVSQAMIQKKCVSRIAINLCKTVLGSIPSNSQGQLSNSTNKDVYTMRVKGAEMALADICRRVGPDLMTKFPVLSSIIGLKDVDEVKRSLVLLRTLFPHVHPMILGVEGKQWLCQLTEWVLSDLLEDLVRIEIASLISWMFLHARDFESEYSNIIYDRVLSTVSLAYQTGKHAAQHKILGAVFVIRSLTKSLNVVENPIHMNLIPSLTKYSMLLMSWFEPKIRVAAAEAFAVLVQVAPLQVDASQTELYKQTNIILNRNFSNGYDFPTDNYIHCNFLENLITGKSIQRVEVVNLLTSPCTFRQYQQHGIDWLYFLLTNHLSGILADDMGLGKTLQALAAIAAFWHSQNTNNSTRKIGLVVCPPVVTAHWLKEATKYFSTTFHQVLDLSECSKNKTFNQLSQTLKHQDPTKLELDEGVPTGVLLITTYAYIRREFKRLNCLDISVLIVDEVHLIRNPRSALFTAVTQLKARHRIAISGTPVQNNVTDIWAIFEFLMPGYLGDAAAFRQNYVSPIQQCHKVNATTKQKEMAAIAISDLHQKILPFVLRRTKQQVLKDLPPKFVTDLYLPMSPLQKKLYAKVNTSLMDSPDATTETINPVFHNLQLLRQICVHPRLAYNHTIIKNEDQIFEGESSWMLSGKLLGLRDLLVNSCNMTGTSDSDTVSVTVHYRSRHRALIFANLHQTLDLVEEMLSEDLQNVKYRRIDGTISHKRRGPIVDEFNKEGSDIDVLLLTTATGGLGLTLTGADTVIFLEHSWNPFVDLQAMDRAHRIGQKNTVQVFRLIMKDTIEEHIRRLQSTKEDVAEAVVGVQDSNESMIKNTSHVLQLLQKSSDNIVATLRHQQQQKNKGRLRTDTNSDTLLSAWTGGGAQHILNQLEDLWDESSYDMHKFPDLDEGTDTI